MAPRVRQKARSEQKVSGAMPRTTLLDIGADMLTEVHKLVDFTFALRMTCRAFRDACPTTKELPLQSGYTDAVASMRMAVWAHDECGCSNKAMLATRAAEQGCEEVLFWLYNFTNHDFNSIVLKLAARAGHHETLEWLFSSGGMVANAKETRTCDGAAEGGHLGILKWAFHLMGCSYSRAALVGAAENGHLDCVNWLLANPTRYGRDKAALVGAMGGGHMPIVMRLRDEKYPWCWEAVERAAAGGHTACLMHALADGCEWSFDGLVANAAFGGHLETIEALRRYAEAKDMHDEAAEPWSEMVLESAMDGGALNVLKVARADPEAAPIDADLLWRIAADNGHYEMLEWAIEQFGTPTSTEACCAAVQNGNLDSLKWLRARGFPWDGEVLSAAACSRNGREMIEWVLENGCEVNPQRDPPAMMESAAICGHLDTLKWLFGKYYDCRWNPRHHTILMEYAMHNNRADVMDWLMCAGCPYDRKALLNVSRVRHLIDRVQSLFHRLRAVHVW